MEADKVFEELDLGQFVEIKKDVFF